MEFSGRLSSFPPSDLLQWALNDRRSGALVLRRSEREKRVYFHGGAVIGCLSNDPAEFYGQHLLLNGYLQQDQLFQALTHCTTHKVRLGTALVELGLMTPERIQQTLRSQIEDSICDLFLWERGVFFFQAELPQEEEILPEPIHAMGLIMEGTRWLDEYRRIRKLFVHDNMVVRRGSGWPGDHLNPVERRIASELDGKRTLAELYKVIRGSYFRFLEAAYRLAIVTVLDIDSVGEPIDHSTSEMSVYDLLLEQATEEQILVAHRHMAVPLDLLERCVPVWVGEPGTEEQTRMPARARDFYARLDGRTTLGEAFSGDARLRGREMDLLLLQLQKGRLALLPAAIPELEAEASRRGLPPLDRWWNRVFTQVARPKQD
jgi:hypothetical protein